MAPQNRSDRKLVLVTGASGFVGRSIIPSLLRAGFAVRAATRRPVSFPQEVQAVVIPDLKNAFDWAPVLQGVNAIIHLAALAHVSGTDGHYSEFNEINWMATQRLADAAKAAGIEHFIFTSTVRAQVGAFAATIVHEADEPRPTNNYGYSKLAAEKAIRVAGVPFTIFRPVVMYGPNPKGNMRTVLRLARSSLPIPIFNNHRSLLAVDNFVSAAIFALKTPAMMGKTYLIADAPPITTCKLFAMLRKIEGRRLISIPIPRILTHFMTSLVGRGDLTGRLYNDLVVDTSKLEATGWHPVVDTYEGLRRMMQLTENL